MNTDQIAFARLGEGERGRIHLVQPDDGAVRALTDPKLSLHDPAWSPDGSRLVALGRGRDDGLLPQLYIIDAASGEAERITHDGVPKGSPAWSPDGSEIFVGLSVGNRGYDLIGLRPDGSGLHQITGPPFEGELPPVLDAANAVAWVREAKAGDETPSDGMRAWSPDGGAIAFVRSSVRRGPGPHDAAIERHIWTMGVDGQGEGRLTEGPVQDDDPAFAPDGARIAFTRYLDDGFINDPSGSQPAVRLYVMNADGTDLRALTQEPADCASPSWSPDGTWLVCSRFINGPTHLFAIQRMARTATRSPTRSRTATTIRLGVPSMLDEVDFSEPREMALKGVSRHVAIVSVNWA